MPADNQRFFLLLGLELAVIVLAIALAPAFGLYAARRIEQAAERMERAANRHPRPDHPVVPPDSMPDDFQRRIA